MVESTEFFSKKFSQGNVIILCLILVILAFLYFSVLSQILELTTESISIEL